MVYFVLAFKVLLLLWPLLKPSTSTTHFNGNVSDGGVIASFLNNLIQPYLETNQSTAIAKTLKPKVKSKRDKILDDIEHRIKIKVKELYPLLQDREYTDNIFETENNLKLEGNDDTTIIEFVPKSNRKTRMKFALNETKETDTFQNKIEKYKELRKNITRILDREKIERSTKMMVRRTLDEMLTQLIERQCTWKSMDATGLKNHFFGARANVGNTINKLKTLTDKDWMDLRQKYEKFLKHHAGEQSEFMNTFQDYFSSFFNFTSNLSKKYKIRCKVVELDDVSMERNIDSGKTYFRSGKRNECGSFKVCSEELNNFLNVTYYLLNETGVNIFGNYAAMYIRDVQEVTAFSGNDVVASVLQILRNFAEKTINKIYVAKLNDFTLDNNKNNAANIQLIKNFITETTVEIKNSLRKIMENELRITKNQLFSTMEADLTVNLKMEMDNLSKSIVDNICKDFILCNGRMLGARKSGHNNYMPRNTENLYVKVQVTFDDELKKTIARYGRRKDWPGDLTRRLVKSLADLRPTKTTVGSPITSGNKENEIINTFF